MLTRFLHLDCRPGATLLSLHIVFPTIVPTPVLRRTLRLQGSLIRAHFFGNSQEVFLSGHPHPLPALWMVSRPFLL